MKILNFLMSMVFAINQFADEKADDYSAMCACDGDYYDENAWSGVLLLVTLIISAAACMVLIGVYVSIGMYLCVGVVIPTYEMIPSMSTLPRILFMVTSPLSIPFTLFFFHYARHAGWRFFLI